MKVISIVTPTYNEEGNVQEVYRQVKEVCASLPYKYEHIFIDNASTDKTVEILREIAGTDPKVKVIVNARNFGHIRSPYYGLLQATGDACILLAGDLQDPPNLLPQFLQKWEEGFKIVLGVKGASDESWLLFRLRKIYYGFLYRISGTELTRNATGFGLYDKKVVEILRQLNDPYPYFRGLIAEIGFPRALIEYHQPKRKRGLTKNNFYTLYDIAMLGITNHSKVPLRIATIAGFILSGLGCLSALGYLIAKLVFWNIFPAGVAPIVIGGFTFLSIQLLFIGLIGEYVAAIYTQVQRRPLVIERERINFGAPSVSAERSTTSGVVPSVTGA